MGVCTYTQMHTMKEEKMEEERKESKVLLVYQKNVLKGEKG